MDSAAIAKSFRTARILQGVFLLAVLVYVGILVAIEPMLPLTTLDAEDLRLVTIVLAVIGVSELPAGYFVARTMTNAYREDTGTWKVKPSEGQYLISVGILRAAFLESIAAYGLILGMLGTGWATTAAFFFVSAAGLILTFPTQEGCDNGLEELTSAHTR